MVSRVAYSTHVITVGILLYLSTPAHTVHSTDTDATRPTSTHRRKLQNEQRHETVSTGSEITQLVSTYLDLEP